MQCQYYHVYFHFFLPSTFTHPCLLDNHPSSSSHPVLAWTSLHVAMCSKWSLQASEGITGTGSGSLLQVQSLHKAKSQTYSTWERLMLYEGKGLSGLWGGGSLADVVAWRSGVWCDRSLCCLLGPCRILSHPLTVWSRKYFIHFPSNEPGLFFFTPSPCGSHEKYSCKFWSYRVLSRTLSIVPYPTPESLEYCWRLWPLLGCPMSQCPGPRHARLNQVVVCVMFFHSQIPFSPVQYGMHQFCYLQTPVGFWFPVLSQVDNTILTPDDPST